MFFGRVIIAIYVIQIGIVYFGGVGSVVLWKVFGIVLVVFVDDELFGFGDCRCGLVEDRCGLVCECCCVCAAG